MPITSTLFIRLGTIDAFVVPLVVASGLGVVASLHPVDGTEAKASIDKTVRANRDLYIVSSRRTI
jgi:hypothetical protein